jgi:hypothetical protein
MRYSWKFQENQFKKTSPTYVAYCRAFSLLDKIRELKAEKKTSSEGPDELLDIMKKLTEGCVKKVNRLDNDLLLLDKEHQQAEHKSIENTIRAVALSVNILHAFLRYVDATRLSRNPTGMIKPWELLIKKFCGNLNIIIRPQWKHNYSYYNIITILNSVNDIIGDKRTEEELEKIGPYFPILSFAGLERDNVLLHIILAHEIGHLIDEIKKFSAIDNHRDQIIEILQTEPIAKKLEEFYNLSINLMKALQDVTTGVAYDLFIEHEAKSQAQKELVNKILKWLGEITADFIAVRIIGPSFIFALYQTQLAQVSKMGPAGDYPPPQIRIENCIKYWESFGKDNEFFRSDKTEKTEEETDHRKITKCIKDYLKTIKEHEKEAPRQLTTVDKLKTQRYNLLNDILKVIVEKPLHLIEKSIEDELLAFELDNTIFGLMELLKNRISPVVAEDRAGEVAPFKCDIASILNAGWIFWLTHDMVVSEVKQAGEPGEIMSLEKLREMCYAPLAEISDLILKGIDLTDYNKQFADRKRIVKSEAQN